MPPPSPSPAPSPSPGQTPRRGSHLMDPAVLRANYEHKQRAEAAARAAGAEIDTSGETVYVTDRAEKPGGMSIGRVREFVLSVLAATTLFHLSVGLALGGYLSDDRTQQIGLNVLAMVTGVAMVASARLIHGKSLVSAWMLLGPVIGLVGLGGLYL